MPRRSQCPTQTGNTSTKTDSDNNCTTSNLSDTRRGLLLLAEVCADREANLQTYEPLEDVPSDNDCNSESPHFDRFYEEGGGEGIKKLTNFDPIQFLQTWNLFSNFVSTHYNVAKGRKSKTTGKDAFFIMLVVVKHGGAWDFLSKLFGMKAPTFESFVNRFVKLLAEPIYESSVKSVASNYSMRRLRAKKTLFKTYSYARYATNVTFQQSYRPSGSLQEAKKHYSGKHNLYGYKVEVSVLPNGLASGCTKHYPSSVSDLSIFQENVDFYDYQSRKTENESAGLEDLGEQCAEYPNNWGILADKGYQGAMELVRVIHPKKKPANGELSRSDIQRNTKVSSDRVLVENYFGRLCALRHVMSEKWKWCEQNYDFYFKVCLGLTNMHVRWSPLRDAHLDYFRRVRTRTYEIGVCGARKRRLTQQRYRERRRARTDVQFRTNEMHARQTEFDI